MDDRFCSLWDDNYLEGWRCFVWSLITEGNICPNPFFLLASRPSVFKRLNASCYRRLINKDFICKRSFWTAGQFIANTDLEDTLISVFVYQQCRSHHLGSQPGSWHDRARQPPEKRVQNGFLVFISQQMGRKTYRRGFNPVLWPAAVL